MAKNNKYASINFNHIYEKSTATNPHNRNPSHSVSPSSSSYSSASYSSVSAPNKAHGRILVLTRPTPKPVTPPTPQPQPHHQPPPNPIHQTQDQPEPPPDAISLRPLGRTGTASSLSSLPVINHDNKDMPSPPPKSDKFVPPHLRPGFVPREESPPGPGSLRPNGRPKSGGGHEKMRRGGQDAGIMGRGSRPNSSG
ncbi:bromodomain-containing protein 4 [Vigna umbellata]|uniref:bromodomain-containing protein 4 n=1 Tax=Vigna umbellata TaxID=87088 RepID=UPI001F5F7D8B|nr:bromodomain-containing protein 4 [Vigna umbellata]